MSAIKPKPNDKSSDKCFSGGNVCQISALLNLITWGKNTNSRLCMKVLILLVCLRAAAGFCGIVSSGPREVAPP